MSSKISIVCALLTLVITCVSATYRSESLDLIEHCCAYRCGRIDAPLEMNSDGLEKTDDQYSDLTITSIKEFKEDDKDPHESYCMINIYTVDYTMLNLTYYLDSDVPENSVVVSDNDR